jgi:hypothetical protein
MADEMTGGITARIVGFVEDAFAVTGAILITYGVEQIYVPAGFITAGAFFLSAAWLAARKDET